MLFFSLSKTTSNSRRSLIMQAKIVTLPGDGIGPEVVAEGVKALQAVAKRFGHSFTFEEGLIGLHAINETGNPLPDETISRCRTAQAILLGAVGGPVSSQAKQIIRPEAGLLKIRKEFDLYANLRPVRIFNSLMSSSVIKPEIISGVDLLIIRELTGGLYFGQPQGRVDTPQQRRAVDTLEYSENEISRIAHTAFRMARLRRKKVTSVDKANVLASSRLWREVVHEVAADYPDVLCEDMLVDTCAMQLIKNPGQFDIIVTENMFGDILSDEAAMIAGSMGMLPSASLADGDFGLYEPVHGSAPDIAGQGIANPLATIMSTAMMLRFSFKLPAEAQAIDEAVARVIEDGYRCADLPGVPEKTLGTVAMGNKVAELISSAAV
jgi:3-isopropylmalate dehydrogenase